MYTYNGPQAFPLLSPPSPFHSRSLTTLAGIGVCAGDKIGSAIGKRKRKGKMGRQDDDISGRQ